MVARRSATATQLAKYYGAQYTSTSAARLLAHLAVNLPCPLNWQSIPPTYAAEPFRIVDFACGDGALLCALYDELVDRLRTGVEEAQADALHRYLLEEGLWGFDVRSEAIRAARSRLKFRDRKASVEPRHIFLLPLGKSEHHPALGSLDLLRTKLQDPQQLVDSDPVPQFHLAIMNPPFTRNVGGNLVFGDFPQPIRRALQAELHGILREAQLEGTGHAGLAAVFLGLADCYLAPRGRLAMVLPKALLGGVAWRKIRALLLNRYHIEALVGSFEGPDNWNFSEKTSLSEVLLVARKHASGSTNPTEEYTVFANLWQRPRTSQEVSSLASQLLEVCRQAASYRIDEPRGKLIALRSSDRQVGDAYSAPLRIPRFGDCQLFAQGALNRTLTLLRSGVLSIPTIDKTESLALTSLSQFVEVIGPDVKQVHTAFRLSQSQSRCYTSTNARAGYHALWNHDSEQIRTIAQSPNAILVPRDTKLAARLWEQGSAPVLVAERAWLATVRVLAAVAPQPVLSNVWWPMRMRATQLGDGSRLLRWRLARLLVLWINSTPGVLLLLSQVEITRGPWVKLKKGPLHDLPVLDFTLLERREVGRLCQLYDEVQRRMLQPLPAEFAAPQVRERINNAFANALGIEVDFSPLHRLLARDPTVTGHSMPSAQLPR